MQASRGNHTRTYAHPGTTTQPAPTRATVLAMRKRVARRATLEARITKVTTAMANYNHLYASRLQAERVHDRGLMDRLARCSKVLEQLYLAWYRL